MSLEQASTVKKYEKFKKDQFIDILKLIVPVIVLVAISIFFYVVSEGRLLTQMNLILILNQAIIVMIGACGSIFVMAHGGLDFSIGSVLGISALAAVTAADATNGNPVVTILCAVIAGAACGLVTGGLHVLTGIPSFVVSLCMMFLYRGIVSTLTVDKVLTVPTNLSFFNNVSVKIVSLIVILFIAFVIFEYTKIGKYNKAIGGSEVASSMNGIPVKLYKLIAFLICGIAVGVASFFDIVREGSVMPTTGQSYETNVLIALVLGGMPLSGGAKSRFRSVILGSILVAVLNNGLVLWCINDRLTEAIEGVVFLVSVALTYERQNGLVVS